MAASISQIIRCIITLILAFGAGNASGSEEEGEEPSHKEALYVKFHPDFIVNLRADRPRFLMVTIQGMSRENDGIEAAQHHMPAIRHALLMLLSEQTADTIKTGADKKRLMDEALVRIQEVMVAETGTPNIEAVFFTDFVLE